MTMLSSDAPAAGAAEVGDVDAEQAEQERDAVEDDDADRGADDHLAELVGDPDDPQGVDGVHRGGDRGGDADGLDDDAAPLAVVDVGDGAEHDAVEQGVERAEEAGERAA